MKDRGSLRASPSVLASGNAESAAPSSVAGADACKWPACPGDKAGDCFGCTANGGHPENWGRDPPHRSPQYLDGRRNAIKACVAWLHAEAETMNDPHARRLLNATAHGMGVHFARRPALSEGQP